MRYRVNLPMLVLATNDNHRAAVTMREGTIIVVIGPIENDDRFLVIRARNEEFHIFASDLAVRAERVVAPETVQGSTEESPASFKTQNCAETRRARGRS